jgi:hypothetical protein
MTPEEWRKSPGYTRRHANVEREQSLSKAEQGRMEHAEGFGIASDHYGALTGTKGRTYDIRHHPELIKLRVSLNQGHITREQHAAAVEELLSAPPPERTEYDTRIEGVGKIPKLCIPKKT